MHSEDSRPGASVLFELDRLSRLLLDTVNALIVVLDTEGRPVLFNRVCEECTGYRFEEVRDRPVWETLIPPGERDGVQEVFEMLCRQQTLVHYTNHWLTKQGDLRLIEWSNSFFRDARSDRIFVVGTGIDITIQRETEAALIRSEAWLRSIFRAAPTGVGVVRKRIMIQVNDRICEMLGYTSEELVGQSARMIYPTDEEFESVGREKYRQIQEHGSGSVETRWRRKDGEIIEVLLNSTPLDPSNHDLGISFTALDITERSRASRALRESEEKYRNVVERANDGILIVQDFLIKYANCRMAEIIGYGLEEIINTSFERYLSGAWAALVVDRYQRRLAGESVPTPYEAAVRHKQGHDIDVEISGGIVRFEDRPADLVFVRDITERTHAQRQMTLLRELLQSTIDSMPSVMVGVDTSLAVTQWNHQAARLMKRSSAASLGRPLADVFPNLSGQLPTVEEAIRRQEVRLVSKVGWEVDGELRMYDLTIYPLTTGNAEGAVLRIDDITERVRLEQMMIQSEKMLSVGGLAAGMAHEINNPLGGMVQNAHVVLNRLCPGYASNDRVARECGTNMESIAAYMDARGILSMLESIRASGSKAARIIQNMLSFSRKASTVAQPHDMVGIVDRSLELAAQDFDLKKLYSFRDIEVVRDYEDDLPPVECQEIEIEQVLLNLFRNAAQALRDKHDSDAGARLTVRIRREDETVRIEIEDNGPGMSEGVRHRVFEPFFTTKPPGVGTGLGLSVSYFIVVEHHRGTITVESQPGKGTCFVVRLPLSQ